MSWGSRGYPGSGWLNARQKLDGGVVNRSLPVLDLKQTWANSTQAFTGLRLDIADRGSTAGSASVTGPLLADLRVNGVSQFAVKKDGWIMLNGPVNTASVIESTVPFRTGALYIGWNNGAGASGCGFGSSFSIFGACGTNGFITGGYYSMATGAGSTPDVIWARDAANAGNQRNGTNGQIARWSRTHTDASNYERVELDCSTNTFRFGPRAAGTGTARVLYLETGSTVVASLASAATVGTGARAFVTDATATTFASVVAGGGSSRVPVYSDGTDWRIG
jgi:hypothetical protein